MAKFVKIARVALRSKLEYLEKIGVPAGSYTPPARNRPRFITWLF
ncbi:MAG: hypothetical protein RDU76_00245 [Candidatus Edwardsbacteria bacterium]|nr:hypothetical protein [Candidatus Edwardsbacteria bacterium]